MLTKVLSAKVAGAAMVALLGGSAAAAATGSLPGPLQGVAARGLSHVGLSVPAPAASGSSNADGGAKGTRRSDKATHGSSSSARGRGPSAAVGAPDLYGLCTAYAASGGQSPSVAMRNLRTAAAAAGDTVTAYCSAVPRPAGTAGSGAPDEPSGSGTTGKSAHSSPKPAGTSSQAIPSAQSD